MSRSSDRPIELHIPAKLEPLLQPKRFKIAYGGRGSAKSHTVAQVLVALAARQRLRILCVREVQKSIRESVHHLLRRYIDSLSLADEYDPQRTTIIHRVNGSAFLFTGMQDHNAETIKSYEDIDICWAEEARALSERSLELLTPTIRGDGPFGDGAEIWMTLNPELESDPVYREFIAPALAGTPRPDTWLQLVNHSDNPWFPEVLRAEMERMRELYHDLYLHIWEGHLRSDAGLVFKRAWFADRYDAPPAPLHVYLSSDFAITQDGGDWTEHAVWGVCSEGRLWALDWWFGQVDTGAGIDRALDLARRWKPMLWFAERDLIVGSIAPAIRSRMAERNTWATMELLPMRGRKVERAAGFVARCSHGMVRFPRTDWSERAINQLCAFTGEDGRQDDAVDACAVFSRGLDSVSSAWKPEPAPARREPEPFTEAWMDYDPEAEAEAEARKRYLS